MRIRLAKDGCTFRLSPATQTGRYNVTDYLSVVDDVAINDLPHAQAKIDAVVQEITALGRRSIGVTGDVSDFEQTEALMAKVSSRLHSGCDSYKADHGAHSPRSQVVEGLGRLDTVIANAGVLHIKPLLETTVEDRRKIVNVNVRRSDRATSQSQGSGQGTDSTSLND